MKYNCGKPAIEPITCEFYYQQQCKNTDDCNYAVSTISTRLEGLQAEREALKYYKYIPFDLKKNLNDYYEHEIEAIGFWEGK